MSCKNKLYIYSKAVVRKDYLLTRKFLEKSAYWSSDEIRQYQENAISKIIDYSINNVPYYKKLIDEKKLIIPEKWSINITPPAGNFMILLLATGQESINIRTDSNKDNQGSVQAKLNIEKSKAFLRTLNTLNPEDFQMVIFKGVIK
jgi:hypothetical protein